MLFKDFYKVVSLNNAEGSKHNAIVLINEHHDIFKGHFPGNPVMPGVCMMQVIKELTEEITSKTLLMQSLSNAKFMALINPFVHPELIIELDIAGNDEEVKVKGTVLFNETV